MTDGGHWSDEHISSMTLEELRVCARVGSVASEAFGVPAHQIGPHRWSLKVRRDGLVHHVQVTAEEIEHGTRLLVTVTPRRTLTTLAAMASTGGATLYVIASLALTVAYHRAMHKMIALRFMFPHPIITFAVGFTAPLFFSWLARNRRLQAVAMVKPTHRLFAEIAQLEALPRPSTYRRRPTFAA